MAYYEYECGKCGHRFTLKESYAEHDRHKQVECPQCKCKDVRQHMESVHVKTARKS